MNMNKLLLVLQTNQSRSKTVIVDGTIVMSCTFADIQIIQDIVFAI